MLRNTFNFILKNAYMLTKSVKHLSFICEDAMPFPFVPGQFITLNINVDGRIIRRSYSIASIPRVDTTIDIAASYVKEGIGSELLFNLQPGDKVIVTGPFGKLVLRNEQPERYILVATGTGITPYRAMLPEIAERIKTQNIQVVLLFGVQTRADLLYAADFLQLAEQFPENFSFRAHFSREKLEDSKAHEHAGYVHSSLEKLNLNPAKDIVYLCGNPNMIDQAYEHMKNLGFEQHNVRREKYISSK